MLLLLARLALSVPYVIVDCCTRLLTDLVYIAIRFAPVKYVAPTAYAIIETSLEVWFELESFAYLRDEGTSEYMRVPAYMLLVAHWLFFFNAALTCLPTSMKSCHNRAESNPSWIEDLTMPGGSDPSSPLHIQQTEFQVFGNQLHKMISNESSRATSPTTLQPATRASTPVDSVRAAVV